MIGLISDRLFKDKFFRRDNQARLSPDRGNEIQKRAESDHADTRDDRSIPDAQQTDGNADDPPTMSRLLTISVLSNRKRLGGMMTVPGCVIRPHHHTLGL